MDSWSFCGAQSHNSLSRSCVYALYVYSMLALAVRRSLYAHTNINCIQHATGILVLIDKCFDFDLNLKIHEKKRKY